MPIHKDAEGLAALKKIVSRRLSAARRTAGLSEAEAAKHLGHKGSTQVSLAESGGRVPPVQDMVKYADLYCTSLDFLTGRINDPLAEEEEHSSSLVARNVGQSITACFEKFSNALSEHAAVCISGNREDRKDLLDLIEVAKEVETALGRIREMNPEYDDLRGGSTLEARVRKVSDYRAKIEARMHNERVRFSMIDKALEIERAGESLEQFALTLNA